LCATTLLHVQVWQRSIPAAAAALLPPLYQAGPAAQEAGDVLLGAAGVDLGLLRVLPALEGWYNLEDGEGAVRGQLKVGDTHPMWGQGIRACAPPSERGVICNPQSSGGCIGVPAGQGGIGRTHVVLMVAANLHLLPLLTLVLPAGDLLVGCHRWAWSLWK
jgi:hypothetical protein